MQEKNDLQVCVIIPYFGKWPNYFQLFLQSIGNHPLLHFHFYTDIDPIPQEYTNIKYIKSSLRELRDRFSEILGVPCPIPTAYKLCDFKPAYGHLFQEDIKQFSHWGFGDIDLIYGNIDHFLTRTLLETFDVISCREEYLSGALSIFKNSRTTNLIYKKSRDYKKVFSDNEFYSFCECNFQWNQVISNRNVVLNPIDIEHMSYVIKQANQEGYIQANFSTIIKESIPSNDYVHIGKNLVIEKSGREFLFYHFITEKKIKGFQFPSWIQVPQQYYINTNGFYLISQFNGFRFWCINTSRIFYHKLLLVKYYFGRLMTKLKLA